MLTIPTLLTVPEYSILIGKRFKQLRLSAGFKRATIAQRSGVSDSSIKRFETTGQVSLKNLLRLAQATNHLTDFSNIFLETEATTLDELRDMSKKKIRMRGVR